MRASVFFYLVIFAASSKIFFGDVLKNSLDYDRLKMKNTALENKQVHPTESPILYRRPI